MGKIIATRTEGETKPFSRSVTLINFKSFKAPDQDKIKISEYFLVFKKLYFLDLGPKVSAVSEIYSSISFPQKTESP